MIPAKHASKIGLYDITVHKNLIKVRVVDNSDVVILVLSELKSEIRKNMYAGIMVRDQFKTKYGPHLIVLCVKSHCLIIQLDNMDSIPGCLIDFVNDKEICFVSPAMSDTLNQLSSYKQIFGRRIVFLNPTVMDVGDLAAKILQDPSLVSKKQTSASKPIAEHMQSIADKAGVTLEKDIDFVGKASIDLLALAFSPEEIKCLVADVYASYLIAAKLFESL